MLKIIKRKSYGYSGAHKDYIEVIGTGYDNPFYKNDHDHNNGLIENIAQKNRTVILLSSNNRIVQSLKEKFLKKN